MESNNLKLWNSVEETDPNHTKQVTYGNKFTSINATYQIKNATEQFGTYGDKWGIKSIEYDFIDVVDNQVMVLAKAIFKYPLNGVDVTFPISSTIYMQEYSKKWECVKADDEWAKKIETDITTKALSKLGFNADVFMGMYDDNKYINNLKEKYKDTPPPKPLPPIDDEKFGKYCDWIKDAITDKKGNLIDIDYLKARHTLNDEQEQELANVNLTT